MLRQVSRTNQYFSSIDLIVDDSDTNRLILSKYLKKLGRDSEEVSNGKQAIKKIEENLEKYGIIWMDLHMPIMNGIACSKKIKDELIFNGLIIGITGHIDEYSVENCMLAGMEDVVAKPLEFEELEKTIKKHCKHNHKS